MLEFLPYFAIVVAILVTIVFCNVKSTFINNMYSCVTSYISAMLFGKAPVVWKKGDRCKTLYKGIWHNGEVINVRKNKIDVKTEFVNPRTKETEFNEWSYNFNDENVVKLKSDSNVDAPHSRRIITRY